MNINPFIRKKVENKDFNRDLCLMAANAAG